MNLLDWDQFETWLQRKHDRNLKPMDYIRGLHEVIGMQRKFIEHVAHAVSGTSPDPAQEGEK